ncbi:hypothetical protein AX16_004968 [Volvariella volvacea WC 439]|nr:hypothetical protein AX16_004968 [Volvariella volvacea WC 439]
MISSVEQAISDVISHGASINVYTVLNAYLRVSGYSTICEDAIVAFERALDKQTVFPTRTYADAIVEIRNQYWTSKRGRLSTVEEEQGGYRICECCGAAVPLNKYRVSRSVSTQDDEPSSPEPQRNRRRTRGKRSKHRHRPSPPGSLDPSTSPIAL